MKEAIERKLKINRWYFIPLFLLFGLVFWKIGMFAFLIWLISTGLIFYRFKFEEIIYFSVIFLLITAVLIILIQDEMSKVSAAFVYYFVLIGFFFKTLGDKEIVMIFFKKPSHTSDISQLTKENKKFKIFDKKNQFEKKNRISTTVMNIFIIGIYLLLFGFNLPDENNYLGFLSFLFILFILNFLSFFKSDLRKFFYRKNEIHKNNNKFFVLLINISVLIIYYLIFGFSGYSKYFVLILILAIINLIIYFDVSNEE